MELIKPPGLTKPGNGKAQQPVIQVKLKEGVKPTQALLQSIAGLVDAICDGHNVIIIAPKYDFAAIQNVVHAEITRQDEAETEAE